MAESEKAALQRRVDALLDAERRPFVLEAGCGSYSHVTAGPDAYVVGVDISEQQLRENDHLDEKILGDIQTHDLGTGRFDMIVCWDVLEHLPQPVAAMERFVRALRPAGVVVIAVPHVRSLKGVIAKWTPFWFHVFVYRYLMALAWAGRTHRGPYPTYLRTEIAPDRIIHFAERNGLSVEYLAEYESWAQQRVRERVRLNGRMWQAVQVVVRTLSGGHVRADVSDAILVLRKPEQASAS